MRFPTIKADGYVGMRYASDLNDWIDFVVLTVTALRYNSNTFKNEAPVIYWKKEG